MRVLPPLPFGFFFVFMLFSITACEKGSTLPKDQSTPQETISKRDLAVKDDDQERFLSCLDYTDDNRELGVSLFRFSRAIYELRKTVIKKYGENAWAQMGKKGTGEDDVVLKSQPIGEPWWRGVEIVISGDKAHFVNPWTSRPEFLTLRDGAWRFGLLSDPSLDPLDPAARQSFAAVVQSLTAAI